MKVVRFSIAIQTILIDCFVSRSIDTVNVALHTSKWCFQAMSNLLSDLNRRTSCRIRLKGIRISEKKQCYNLVISLRLKYGSPQGAVTMSIDNVGIGISPYQ